MARRQRIRTGVLVFIKVPRFIVQFILGQADRLEPGLFIGCRGDAAEAPAGQGVATETPAGVLVEYAEAVEGTATQSGRMIPALQQTVMNCPGQCLVPGIP